MRELVNKPEPISTHCYEYPDVLCKLGPHYPHCDMSCPMNSYARDILAGNKPKEAPNAQQQGNHREIH